MSKESTLPAPFAASAEMPSHLAEAMRIQDDVHNRLVYSRNPDIAGIPNIEAVYLNLTRQTNCIGFTVTGSKQLENAGVDHYVGFVNGHSTTIVPDRKPDGTTSLWLVDMLGRRLTQDVTDAFIPTPEHISGLQGQVNNDGRTLVTFNSMKLGTNTGWSFDKLVHTYPWLSAKESFYNPDSHLKMTLFEPRKGRQVIAAYSRFQEATFAGDVELASDAVLEMSGNFPDIDIRNHHPKAIRSLTKKLTHAGQPDKAVEVTNAFFDSFAPSEDTRVAEYRADCLRDIAKTARSSGRFGDRFYRGLVNEARETYANVVGSQRAYSSVAAKMAICESMLSEA